MFKQRLYAGALALALSTLIIYLSLSHAWIFVVALFFFAWKLSLEVAQLCQHLSVPFSATALTGSSIALCTAHYLELHHQVTGCTAITLCCMFLVLGLMFFKTTEKAFQRAASFFFWSIYITLPLYLLVDLQTQPSWLIWLIVTVKGSDVGAYFLGKLYGNRKLAYKISPKKTVEGAYGGIGTAGLLSVLLYPHPSIIQALLLGSVMGGLAILGDLFESSLKREAGIKDSGDIPGLGGLLDMVDSLLFAIPIIYLYLRTLI